MKILLKTLFIVFLCSVLLNCFQQSSSTSFKHRSGISFDFPEGWDQLSKQEWRDLDMGKDRTLITIMNAERSAGFSVIPVDLDLNSQLVFGMLGDETEARTAMILVSIDAAGPSTYIDYELFIKGPTTFAGIPMGEIIFQGQNPGKSLKWYRVLVLAIPNSPDAMIMFVQTAPLGEGDIYEKDFKYIEDSWKWEK